MYSVSVKGLGVAVANYYLVLALHTLYARLLALLQLSLEDWEIPLLGKQGCFKDYYIWQC